MAIDFDHSFIVVLRVSLVVEEYSPLICSAMHRVCALVLDSGRLIPRAPMLDWLCGSGVADRLHCLVSTFEGAFSRLRGS